MLPSFYENLNQADAGLSVNMTLANHGHQSQAGRSTERQYGTGEESYKATAMEVDDVDSSVAEAHVDRAEALTHLPSSQQHPTFTASHFASSPAFVIGHGSGTNNSSKAGAKSAKKKKKGGAKRGKSKSHSSKTSKTGKGKGKKNSKSAKNKNKNKRSNKKTKSKAAKKNKGKNKKAKSKGKKSGKKN